MGEAAVAIEDVVGIVEEIEAATADGVEVRQDEAEAEVAGEVRRAPGGEIAARRGRRMCQIVT